MLHNETHQIVHSSAMYYQNFIIIHGCSKNLLKIKNSKVFFNTRVQVQWHEWELISL